MKTYADYGKGKIKILHSCLIEIEDISEWVAIETALGNDLKRERERIKELGEYAPEYVALTEQRIELLEKIIPQLKAINTIPMEQFDTAKIRKDLWQRDELDEEKEAAI